MILCYYSSITLSVTYTPLMTDDIDVIYDYGDDVDHHHFDDDDFLSFIESSFDKDEVLSRGIGSATIQGMMMFND